MRKVLNSLCFVLALCGVSFAQDVAVLSIKMPTEKKLKQVVIEFDEQNAPETSANFKRLAKKGFYNKQTFHRVFPGTLVQAGDPLSKGKDRAAVGTTGPGYTLAPEIRAKHQAGAVAMARLPDRINPARRSNGSQFYITLKPAPQLDGEYTVFGRVISGIEVLDAVSKVPADSNDNPLQRVMIRKVRIVPRAKAGV